MPSFLLAFFLIHLSCFSYLLTASDSSCFYLYICLFPALKRCMFIPYFLLSLSALVHSSCFSDLLTASDSSCFYPSICILSPLKRSIFILYFLLSFSFIHPSCSSALLSASDSSCFYPSICLLPPVMRWMFIVNLLSSRLYFPFLFLFVIYSDNFFNSLTSVLHLHYAFFFFF